MWHKPKRDSTNIQEICDCLNNKSGDWVKALWELIEYLVCIQFSKRRLSVKQEVAWDATTSIFEQIKQRIDCVEKEYLNGRVDRPQPIKNIVDYVYFVLPKRFAKWCSTNIEQTEKEKAMVSFEYYDEESGCYEDEKYYMQECISSIYEESKISKAEVTQKIKEWLGKAENNIELKNRRARLRGQGLEFVDGKLQVMELTDKEMARELAILESKKEELPKLEKRRQKRIKVLKDKLYGKDGQQYIDVQ